MERSFRHILIALALLVLFYAGTVFVGSVVQLANAADRIFIGLGQPVFWLLSAALIIVAVTPIALYFSLPKALVPPAESSGEEHEKYMLRLRESLRKNPRLKGTSIDSNDDVIAALANLSQEAEKVVKGTASTVFVATAVMQNGRLDGLITLITQTRMVWQIASIYYQRPSPRQMLYLYSNVGAAALLAQSIEDIDFSEVVTPIVVSIIPSLKGAVPGLQGISALLVNSLSSGTANALLTLRVGFVARQYCEAVSSPSRQLVRKSATASALKMVVQIAKENSAQIAKSTWGAVSDFAVDTAGAAVHGVKQVAGKVADTTVSGVKSFGGALDTTVQGVKKVAGKSSEAVVSGAKAAGGALGSTVQGVKAGTKFVLGSKRDISE